MRGIALRVGVTHPTVQRWIQSGIPPRTVFDIAVRFNMDLFDTFVAMGWVDPGDPGRFNCGAVLRELPSRVLAEELLRRATVWERAGMPKLPADLNTPPTKPRLLAVR